MTPGVSFTTRTTFATALKRMLEVSLNHKNKLVVCAFNMHVYELLLQYYFYKIASNAESNFCPPKILRK